MLHSNIKAGNVVPCIVAQGGQIHKLLLRNEHDANNKQTNVQLHFDLL